MSQKALEKKFPMNKIKAKKLKLINPFVSQDFKILVNRLEDKTTFVNDNGIYLHKQYLFEREQTTKLYINPIHRKLVCEISNNAKCLLFWICFELDNNQDYLWINKERYLKENNIKSIKTYNASIIELCDKLIICPAAYKDIYFINPRLIFSGSRIKSYPDNLVRYKPNINP